MSLRSLPVVLCVMVLRVAGDWQDPSYPSGYQGGYQQAPTYSYGSGSTNCGPTLPSFGDVSEIASYKSGLLQTGLSAAVAALLAKLPALIFLKVLVLKLIVLPMLFMFVAIPAVMPLLMMLMPMMMSMMNMMGGGMGGGDTTPATPANMTGRADSTDRTEELDQILRSLLGSDRCLERVACTLGVKDVDSPYRKPVTWMLKQLQTMVPPSFRDRVKTYRQAYIAGAGEGRCAQETYPCDTPKLLVKQEDRTFRIL